MTKAELEELFVGYERSEKLQREVYKVIGLNMDMKKDPELGVVDTVENLVSLSEKEGFQYGFKTALLLMMKNRNMQPATVIDLQEYIEQQKPVDE